MTTINTNASNAKASIDFDQGNEQSTEGMTPLEKKLSQPGPLDQLASKQGLQDEAQSFLPGGCVIDDLPEIPTHDQENTVTLNGEEYVIPEGATSVTVENDQVLADGEVLEPTSSNDLDPGFSPFPSTGESIDVSEAVEAVMDESFDVSGVIEDAIGSLNNLFPQAPVNEGQNQITLNGEVYEVPEGTTSVRVQNGEVLADGEVLEPITSREEISFMGIVNEDIPIAPNTEINGSTITVDGQTFEMSLHLTRELDTSLPLINGYDIPPEVGYTINEDGEAEFYVKPDTGIFENVTKPIEIDMDDFGPIDTPPLTVPPNETNDSSGNVQVNNPTFDPVENIDDDADIGSITYDEDQSQDI